MKNCPFLAQEHRVVKRFAGSTNTTHSSSSPCRSLSAGQAGEA